jgi:mRNA interferase RelE/StbE
MFLVTYHKKVIERDIPGLSSENRLKIKKAIESKLVSRPEVFGKPLQNSLFGFRSLRVGEYRVIFILENRKEVFVILVGHRSIVYKDVYKRI